MIEQNPFRENGYAVLMEVLAAGGNEAEAMRTYDRLRALLREHLGLTPSPAVTALAERVLRHQSDDTAISVARPDGGGVAAPGELLDRLPGMVATVADRRWSTGRATELDCSGWLRTPLPGTGG